MRGAERERYQLGVDTEKAHFAALTAALAAFGDGARKAIDEAAGFGDQDTSDVFTEVSRGIDKEQSHLHREFSRRDKLDCSSDIIALGKLEKPRLSARFSPPEPGSPAAGPSSRADRTFSQEGEVPIALGSARPATSPHKIAKRNGRLAYCSRFIQI
jgi:hypothetical protein